MASQPEIYLQDFFTDFESYSTGNINGQGGWVGDGYFYVNTSASYGGGSKAAGNNSGQNGGAYRNINAKKIAKVTFAFNRDGAAPGSQHWVKLSNTTDLWGAVELFWYYDVGANAITVGGNLSASILLGGLSNGWHTFEIAFDITNKKKVWARIDGGAWQETNYTGSAASVTYLHFANLQGSCDFDYIGVYAGTYIEGGQPMFFDDSFALT